MKKPKNLPEWRNFGIFFLPAVILAMVTLMPGSQFDSLATDAANLREVAHATPFLSRWPECELEAQ